MFDFLALRCLEVNLIVTKLKMTFSRLWTVLKMSLNLSFFTIKLTHHRCKKLEHF